MSDNLCNSGVFNLSYATWEEPFRLENAHKLPFSVPAGIVNDISNGTPYVYGERFQYRNDTLNDQLQIRKLHYFIPADQFNYDDKSLLNELTPMHITNYFTTYYWTPIQYLICFIITFAFVIALGCIKQFLFP